MTAVPLKKTSPFHRTTISFNKRALAVNSQENIVNVPQMMLSSTTSLYKTAVSSGLNSAAQGSREQKIKSDRRSNFEVRANSGTESNGRVRNVMLHRNKMLNKQRATIGNLGRH